MGFVDDDRVVALEHAVATNRGQEYAVRHDRDCRIRTGAVGEADAIAHALAERCLELLREALRDRTRGDAAWLSVGDARQAVRAERFQDHLGHLGCLARAGLAGDHHDLVIPERRDNGVASLRDRQVRGVMNAQA